jgi:hypothetical protein
VTGFCTAFALTMSYYIIRAAIVRAFELWLKGPHERNECPVCKQPIQHDHSEDGGQ